MIDNFQLSENLWDEFIHKIKTNLEESQSFENIEDSFNESTYERDRKTGTINEKFFD